MNRLDYAALLVLAARQERRGFLLAANGVAPSRSSLKQRVTRVLDEDQLRAAAYPGWISACVAYAIVAAAALAALSLPNSAETIATQVEITRPAALPAPSKTVSAPDL